MGGLFERMKTDKDTGFSPSLSLQIRILHGYLHSTGIVSVVQIVV